MSGAVPSSTFDIETVGVATILRLLLDLSWMNFIVDLNIKVQLIDSDDMLSSVILKTSSEECLGEEESTDPEHSWSASVDPFPQELDPIVQVLDP